MKKAFTLAEMMIVLVIIAVITSILLPAARHATPDKEILKFKKVNNALATAIYSLVNSDDYFSDGDLGLDKDGARIDEATYFCHALGDIMNAKEKNCSEDNLGYNSSAVANFEDLTKDEINGIKIYEYADCMCKKNVSAGEEIILQDDTVIYSVNPYYHFGSLTQSGAEVEKRLFNLCSKEKRYKFICVDIDGINQGQDPFGYALRADGKLIYGARASAWIKKDLNGDDETTIASVDSCSPTALSITPEVDVCKAATPTVTPTIEPCPSLALKVTLNGKELCMLKYNPGDKPELAIPDTVERGVCQKDTICCWSKIKGSDTDCDIKNGDYSGCNRTLCNYRGAVEICSKLSYGNKSWRLPTFEELSSLGEQINEVSIGQGSNGLMLCDSNINGTSAYCADATVSNCPGSYGNDCWAESIYFQGGGRCRLMNNEYSCQNSDLGLGAFSVRCVSEIETN